jgi:hypothetical protein
MFGDFERGPGDTDWRILGRGDFEGDLVGIDAEGRMLDFHVK